MKKTLLKRSCSTLLILIFIFIALETSITLAAPKKATPKKPIVKTSPWKQVVQFKGNTIKNTQRFNISSNEWRVTWSTKPGAYGDMNFMVFLCDSKGDMTDGIANVIGKASDTSYFYKKGTYSFNINTAQTYVITVEEKK